MTIVSVMGNGDTAGGAMRTFKSKRAAKMAYTKAENEMTRKLDEANSAAWALRHNADNSPRSGWTKEDEERVAALRADADRASDNARAVYDAATAQGFFISSYHFGHNPTRELVLANMD